MSDEQEDAVFRDFEIGDVVTVRLPLHSPAGHEQEGYRPAVVVGVPDLAGVPRFEVLLVAPLTSDKGQSWASESPMLYPKFSEGTANLRVPLICLLDQIRSVDRRRVLRRRGKLDGSEYDQVLDGLFAILGQAPAD